VEERDLVYEQTNVAKPSSDLEFSERLERVRKSFVVFLSMVIIYEAAGINVTSVTPIYIQGSIERPFVIEWAIWVIFIYFLVIYFGIFKKEANLFHFRTAGKGGFYAQLNRHEFEEKLSSKTHKEIVTKASSLIKSHDKKKTVVEYNIPDGQFEDPKLENYDHETHQYTYFHQTEDDEYYEGIRKTIPPSLTFNYLVYVFPLHVSAAVIGIKIGTILVQLIQ